MSATVIDFSSRQRRFGQIVASNVRAEIARRHVPQADVAAALGVTQQAVSLKINGRRPLSLDDLDAIAHLLGMSVAQLVAHDEGPRPGASQDGGRLDGLPRLDSNQKPSAYPRAQVIAFPTERAAS